MGTIVDTSKVMMMSCLYLKHRLCSQLSYHMPKYCISKCTLTTTAMHANKRGKSAVMTPAKIQKMEAKVREKLNRRVTESNIKRNDILTVNQDVMGYAQLNSAKGKTSQGAVRRASVLSKMLQPYIQSMVESGEVDPRLSSLGFIVEEVQVKADLSQVNVIWQSTGTGRDEQIKELLTDASHTLRQSLTNLHLMGRIPPIVFLCSSLQSRLVEVENILKHADLGPDYVPTDLAEQLKETPAREKCLQDIFSDISTKFRDREFKKNTLDDYIESESDLGSVEDYVNIETGSSAEDDENHKQSCLQNEIEFALRSDVYDINHTELVRKIMTGHGRKKRSVQDPITIETSQVDRAFPVKNILPKKYKFKPPSKEKYLSKGSYNRLDILDEDEDVNSYEDVYDEVDYVNEDHYCADSNK